MHRSRLGGLIIDCQKGSLGEAARFWSRALGLAIRPSRDADDQNYAVFEEGPGGLDIEVQKVDHESRIHLDIETDDIEAEVARLEGLGAKRVAWVKGWWVMEAPTGQRFCVVRARSANFANDARTWE